MTSAATTRFLVLVLVVIGRIAADWPIAGIGDISCKKGEVICREVDGFCFCLPEDQVCDGMHDCRDSVDEKGCKCNLKTHFACKSGGCVLKEKVCNGVKECQDKSDEADCKCKPGEFRCEKKFFCIPGRNRCDGTAQCQDRTDEKNCVCRDDQVACKSGGCIDKEKRCNGFADCQDASDEKGCVCKKKSEYACRSGGCYGQPLRCDGWRDCEDGSDEAKCSCDPEVQFQCKSGGCIRATRKCDLKSDCHDNSDETDCRPMFQRSQIVTYLNSCPKQFPISKTYLDDYQYLKYRLCDLYCEDKRLTRQAMNLFSVKMGGSSFKEEIIAIELSFNEKNKDVLPGFLVRKLCTTVTGVKSVSVIYWAEKAFHFAGSITRQVDISDVTMSSEVCSSLFQFPIRSMVMVFTRDKSQKTMNIKGTYMDMCMRNK